MLIKLDSYHLSLLEKVLKDITDLGQRTYTSGSWGMDVEMSYSFKEYDDIKKIYELIWRQQEYDEMSSDEKRSIIKNFYIYLASHNKEKYGYIINKYKLPPEDLFQLDIVEDFLDYQYYLIEKDIQNIK
jgi:hypothetical protein